MEKKTKKTKKALSAKVRKNVTGGTKSNKYYIKQIAFPDDPCLLPRDAAATGALYGTFDANKKTSNTLAPAIANVEKILDNLKGLKARLDEMN